MPQKQYNLLYTKHIIVLSPKCYSVQALTTSKRPLASGSYQKDTKPLLARIGPSYSPNATQSKH
jgi:hypothetical protein